MEGRQSIAAHVSDLHVLKALRSSRSIDTGCCVGQIRYSRIQASVTIHHLSDMLLYCTAYCDCLLSSALWRDKYNIWLHEFPIILQWSCLGIQLFKLVILVIDLLVLESLLEPLLH